MIRRAWICLRLQVYERGSQTAVASPAPALFRSARAGRPTSGEPVSVGSAVYRSPSAAALRRRNESHGRRSEKRLRFR